MVGLAERHVERPDEPVGQIGRRREPGFRGLAHGRRVDRHVADHPGQRGDAQADAVVGVEHRLLVLLQVLGIGQRQALDHGQQADEVADHPAALGPGQLGGIRVALLGHDRRARAEGIG